MKKEKKVRTYQRRTKSGKLVTVKAHTAKYDAAEKAKELAKKKGAGDELAERKKSAAQLEIPFDKDDEKKVVEEVKEVTKKDSEKPTKKSKSSETKSKKATTPKEEKSKATPKSKEAKIKESKPTTSEPAFTAAEFKEWYNGTGSAADKKVAKALRAQLGRAGYRKLEDEAIDNYSVRGHSAMFKRVSASTSESKPSKETAKTSDGKTEFSEKELNAYGRRLYHARNHYVGGPGPKSYQYALRKRKEALEEYHKTDEGKAMKAAYAKYLADMRKINRKKMLEEAEEQKISEARKIVAEADKKSSKLKGKSSNGSGSLEVTRYDDGWAAGGTKEQWQQFLKKKRNESRRAKRVEEVKNQRDEQAKRDKAFLALPKPDKGSKGYATHMALRSFVRQGGFGDDSMRDALVRHGYPKDTAYSKGIKEVIALGRKHGVIPEPKSSKQKAKMKGR